MLHLNVGQKDRRISQLEEEITRTREISVSKSVFLLHVLLFFPHLDTFYGRAQKVQNKDRRSTLRRSCIYEILAQIRLYV